MAHKQVKEKAFKLFKRGFSAPDAAASLKVNLRNVQRWFKEFQCENVATSQEEKSGAASVALVEKKPYLLIDKNLISDDWFEFGNQLVTDHFSAHHEIRVKIQEILNQKLREPDLNLRVLHTLSIAFTRHIEAERTAASLDSLDVNFAARRLNADGYFVSESPEF